MASSISNGANSVQGSAEQTTANGPLTDKGAFNAWRTNHDLHVLLLMKAGKTKAQALVLAYHEGVEGLNKRLG